MSSLDLDGLISKVEQLRAALEMFWNQHSDAYGNFDYTFAAPNVTCMSVFLLFSILYSLCSPRF